MAGLYTIITGASSGIGKGFALHCAKEGHNLLLLGRDETALTTLTQELQSVSPSIDSHSFVGDLTDDAFFASFMQSVRDGGYQLGYLINNAGSGLSGAFLIQDESAIQSMMALNMSVLMKLCHQIGAIMCTQKSGKILNIASTAAFQPIPSMAVYAATKSFVVSLSNALWYERKDVGVSVSCLCPGPTKTAFAERAGLKDSMMFRFAMEVDDVVQAGYAGMLTGERMIIPGKVNKALSRIGAIIPSNISMVVADKIL